jgi:histidinol phosphatase-like PHP family hydrolase
MVERAAPYDVNALVAALLRDLAFAQASQQKMFGYKRAASAVLALDRPLTALVSGRTLDKVRGVGPASARVIFEVLESGGSPTVERAVAASDRVADIERRRRLRAHFLSRAEVLRVLDDPTLDGVERTAYRGDLQMHSIWSDGVPTLADIADACAARGYAYAAVTDHSYGLKIAGGMSMADAARQHAEIDCVNRSRPSFRMIKGIEANIGTDGALDLSEEEVAQFELVLAAPHSKLRIAADQTARLLRAIATPGVHVLAHPRGRITGSRPGVQADWGAVFAASAAAGVAIEIDGDPSRQDLDHTLAARALAAGCLFALDSDAHTTGQLSYADTALAHARLARIPADRIINCWERERLLGWLEGARRSAQSREPRLN